MAIISDDDGSNGKKPQEDEDKQMVKPKQAQNPPTRSFVFPTSSCLLSLEKAVSKYPQGSLFDSVVTGHLQIHGNTTPHGPLLLPFVGFPPQNLPQWYLLSRQITSLQNPFHLPRLPPFPHMLYGSAVVTIGPRMYLFGGCLDYRTPTNRASLVVSKSCSVLHVSLPSMNRNRYRAAAGEFDNKIYVIGGCEMGAGWVEVFDIETQVWSPMSSPYYYPYEPIRPYYPVASVRSGEFVTYAVMKEKLYILDYNSCFSFEPKNRKWELCEKLREYWQGCSCVVDDLLYTIDLMGTLGSYLIVYDPVEKDWRPVHVSVTCGRSWPQLFYYRSKMANLAGWLVILGCNQGLFTEGEKHLWCEMISLERRASGEIEGTVEIIERVLTSPQLPSVEYCPAVTV